MSNNVSTTTVTKKLAPQFVIQFGQNVSNLQNILPTNSHFCQKQNHLIDTITKSNLDINTTHLSIDYDKKENIYICKLQISILGLKTFINRGTQYNEIIIKCMNEAIDYIHDTQNKQKQH
jgi:hypothetical protein